MPCRYDVGRCRLVGYLTQEPQTRPRARQLTWLDDLATGNCARHCRAPASLARLFNFDSAIFAARVLRVGADDRRGGWTCVRT